ncbi:kinesin-like protein KIF11 [Ambystoma mexicanum]|uniref:kinesin-like protein KIF11 n=1 Tax=Ambystoma mexicanum TaxID=8296 RepID=UPI0037E71A5D
MSFPNSILSSKKDDKGKNIQVVVRCRPFNLQERKANSYSVIDCDPSRKDIAVRSGGINEKVGKKTYTFDMVFGPSAKQIEVYRNVVCPILDEVIMGYNCTVFAYGQTGTGKTFTMEGERSPDGEFTWDEDPLAGIIPRTLHQIFEKLSENGTEFSVKVSLLEIYNEELFDLLSPCPDVGERLQMFDDPRNKRGVIIKGLEEITVHNKNEVYQILERGAAKRTTASTLMNAYSSRSHSVFSVTIHMKETTVDGEELVKIGKLNLVDLAGSENIGRSGAVDKRAREAGNINQSLLTLGRVITALVERTPHIPYRESKLTRILQDSLGGRTKTSIIATVSPASINLEETLSTLEYAHRAKNIMNKPEVNQKLTKRALIKEYTEEIERLKRDLAAAREKNGVYISSENYDAMFGKLSCQEEQIAECTEKIVALEEELKRVTELFTENKRELEECSEVLQNKAKELEETHKNLYESKQLLAEEEYVVSALEITEKKLHSTANKLLSTVHQTTKDVCGLHAKLDRRKAVDQYNDQAKDSFAGQMDKLFNTIQKSVDEYSIKQQGMLDFYTSSIGDLLSASSSAFHITSSTVATSFSCVEKLLSAEMTLRIDDILKQETLSLEAKENLQKLMIEHKTNLENTLKRSLLPMVSSIIDLNSHMKLSLRNFSALADKIESDKETMNVFFIDHSKALHKLHKDSVDALVECQTKYECVKQDLQFAQTSHAEGTMKIITSLQNQLNMLAMETEQHFSGILTKGVDLQKSLVGLQEDLELTSCQAVDSAASQHQRFNSSSDDWVQEIRQMTNGCNNTVDGSTTQCIELRSGLASVCSEAEQWVDHASTAIVGVTEQNKSFLHTSKTEMQSLLKNLNESCSSSVASITDQVNKQRDAEESALTTLVDQVVDDKEMLVDQKLELSEQAQMGLRKVFTFLQEELKNDIPTGATPQRKDYSYPSSLVKTKPRDLLLEGFRKQQELQPMLCFDASVVAEAVDQDSLEEEPVALTDDSVIFEKSCPDVNVICQESGGVPFFQHKKGQKREKENKANTTLLERSKLIEDGSEQLLPRSKLPLRIQN